MANIVWFICNYFMHVSLWLLGLPIAPLAASLGTDKGLIMYCMYQLWYSIYNISFSVTLFYEKIVYVYVSVSIPMGIVYIFLQDF